MNFETHSPSYLSCARQFLKEPQKFHLTTLKLAAPACEQLLPRSFTARFATSRVLKNVSLFLSGAHPFFSPFSDGIHKKERLRARCCNKNSVPAATAVFR
jgi:hypothetical protein